MGDPFDILLHGINPPGIGCSRNMPGEVARWWRACGRRWRMVSQGIAYPEDITARITNRKGKGRWFQPNCNSISPDHLLHRFISQVTEYFAEQ
jgi:hypothetical protein